MVIAAETNARGMKRLAGRGHYIIKTQWAGGWGGPPKRLSTEVQK